MKEKKSLKVSLFTFFLLVAIIVITAMAYYIYTEKTNYKKEIKNLEANAANMQDTIDELQGKINSISNTINSDKVSSDEDTISNSEKVKNSNDENSISNVSNKDKSVKYEFTSADQAAIHGYPKILKIFKLNDSEMEFNYNSGFDFSKSTIDRQITGTAKVNDEQKYEFEEVMDGHRYQLIFEFDEFKETVKVHEFDNGNEFGWINLFR